jgi:cellulose synthase/poly-beta-1,6-N-acetylglucosamine synthase-like glycosyltransferase/GGDEF domain-containing protein
VNQPSPSTLRGRRLHEFDAECALLQPPRRKRANWLTIIKLAEWRELRDHLGVYGCAAILEAVSSFIGETIPDGRRLLESYDGQINLVVYDQTEEELERVLLALSRKIVSHEFTAAGETVRVTPAIGYTAFTDETMQQTRLRCAKTALDHSLVQLDLRPTAFSDLLEPPSRWQEWMLRLDVPRKVRFGFHVLLALFLALVAPFLIYMNLPTAVADVASTVVFILTVIVLVTTATLINIEGLLSLRPEQPPDDPATPYPPATAIIAAYLPNEAASVLATVEAILKVDYPAPLQVILAYNTPHELPIEGTLRALAGRDRRFVLLRVEGSTSKAQNINTALSLAKGEFVALFDADHHPAVGSFERAWRWLSHGADVVQGHCMVRNGSASLLSRIIAVEFEQIYAVAHPGGARLRGYGIFGGSNGYWRTSLLRAIRMRGSMLTEDIDSSMRVVCEGGRIVSDPHLISTELAPTTLSSLTHQRLRWNQGWFQVSLRHLKPLLTSKNLSFRQKIGCFYLLAWREIFPWFSLQVFPVLAFWLAMAGSIHNLEWTVPILLVATVYVLSTGPLQSITAFANAAPEIRKRKGWFLLHLLFANLYSEYLTLLTRVAHLRQLIGEREWRVTARAVEDTAPVSVIVDPYHEGDLPPIEEFRDNIVQGGPFLLRRRQEDSQPSQTAAK